MRSTTRLLLVVAAMSAVSIPVAHAQFGGFGGGTGSGVTSNGLPGLGGGTSGFGGFSNGLPGLGSVSGGSGGIGSGSNGATAGQPGGDNGDATSDTTTTPAPAPAPAPAPQATTTDWVCPDGYTPQLDDNDQWVKDANGIPQCVEASILDDF
jgi:hypothetical protein